MRPCFCLSIRNNQWASRNWAHCNAPLHPFHSEFPNLGVSRYALRSFTKPCFILNSVFFLFNLQSTFHNLQFSSILHLHFSCSLFYIADSFGLEGRDPGGFEHGIGILGVNYEHHAHAHIEGVVHFVDFDIPGSL